MIWCAQQREKIKEEEPALKQTEIMAKLGQLWCDMSGACFLSLLCQQLWVCGRRMHVARPPWGGTGAASGSLAT